MLITEKIVTYSGWDSVVTTSRNASRTDTSPLERVCNSP